MKKGEDFFKNLSEKNKKKATLAQLKEINKIQGDGLLIPKSPFLSLVKCLFDRNHPELRFDYYFKQKCKLENYFILLFQEFKKKPFAYFKKPAKQLWWSCLRMQTNVPCMLKGSRY